MRTFQIKNLLTLKATRVVKDIAQVLVQEGFLGPMETRRKRIF